MLGANGMAMAMALPTQRGLACQPARRHFYDNHLYADIYRLLNSEEGRLGRGCGRT